MGYRYAVLGAGRQGVAAAYDIAVNGDADQVILADIDGEVAESGASWLNGVLGRRVVASVELDAKDTRRVAEMLAGVTSVVSALPYSLNLPITETAIRVGANMCDLGGHTGIVRAQLALDDRAKSAGVSIVPDCGMGPGMNVSLATYAMSLLDQPREVYIWDGGLPQDPVPPWNYQLTFNVGGLTNEYFGNAFFLRDGVITEVPSLGGIEEVDFAPPLGTLEAAVTSGGLSTAPWTFQGRLERLENKTLRYPGHWDQFKAYAQLGLLELEPIQVGGTSVVPRDVFHALLEPKIAAPDIRDVCVIRVKCFGCRNGSDAEAIVELIDYYDESAGFTAMQRITGWHAAIVAILAARGRIPRGASPVETAVPGALMVEEARRRGFAIDERTL